MTQHGLLDTFAIAHQVVGAFFPELKSHAYPMLVARGQSFDRALLAEQALASFDIAIEESDAAFKPMTSDTVRDHLLVGTWQFTQEGELDFVFLRGRANRYTEHQALLADLIQHPSWSRAQFRAALSDRDVRFWEENQTAFVSSIQPAVAAFAMMLGGTARNMRVTFALSVERPGPPIPPAQPVAECGWLVRVEVVPVLPSRSAATYALEFEPMGGKLQSIIKTD